VTPAQAVAIFQPFRTDAPDALSGIGLAICKPIVEAHDGRIVVHERTTGGAEFTFSLPRS
jgi:signal transduction histidine kinase